INILMSQGVHTNITSRNILRTIFLSETFRLNLKEGSAQLKAVYDTWCLAVERAQDNTMPNGLQCDSSELKEFYDVSLPQTPETVVFSLQKRDELHRILFPREISVYQKNWSEQRAALKLLEECHYRHLVGLLFIHLGGIDFIKKQDKHNSYSDAYFEKWLQIFRKAPEAEAQQMIIKERIEECEQRMIDLEPKVNALKMQIEERLKNDPSFRALLDEWKSAPRELRRLELNPQQLEMLQRAPRGRYATFRHPVDEVSLVEVSPPSSPRPGQSTAN
ncbi:MAG: hypothetical protein K2Q33_09405, partial [Gammaproteobacteria bacterium]|nr:hypothetical protein [Gammaproteobacteria bacterium]